MAKHWMLVILPLVVSACAGATVPTQMRTYLSAYEASRLSSGAVLVAHGDSVLVAVGFGYADLEHQIRNSAHTRFRVGSITKSMTWAAVHHLARQGALNLEAPVARLIGAEALSSAVTVRHLLSHEGGVADWSTFPDAPAFGASRSSTEELAAWVASKPLIFAPGTDRSYSNSGYILLARVIEAAAGRPYGMYLSDVLFAPLGMTATEHVVEPVADLARGYVQGNEPTPVLNAPHVEPSIFTGSGSVVSTVGDLFMWSRSAAAQEFPWDQRMRHGERVRFMGGFVPGFGAWVEHYVDKDVSVIVLTNLNNGAIQQIVSDLGAMMLGQPHEAPERYRDREVSDGPRNAFSGSWACGGGGPEFTIRAEQERLEILWRHREPSQPLWLQSDSEIFYPQDWAKIRVRDTGDAHGLIYEGFGARPNECKALAQGG